MRKGFGFHDRHSPFRFDPATLFIGGAIKGAFYNPSTISSLFQDDAGTTPVTAVEQTVGRILDLSGNGNHATQSVLASRPTYRARYNLELQSEDFTSSSALIQNATVTANQAIAPDGTLTADSLIENTANNQHRVGKNTSNISFIAGQSYTVSVYVKRASGTRNVILRLDFGSNNFGAAGTNFDLTTLAINPTAGQTATISSVGNGWYRLTMTATAAISYTATYSTSVSLTNGTSPIDSGYAGDGTSGVFLWGAQILPAADVATTGNAYQRVAAATSYDTSSPVWRPYLAFDGSNDSMLTSAIDFTGTDKMTVWAGVTKLSDATAAIVAELSSNISSNNGAFYLAAPVSNGSATFQYASKGTTFDGVTDSASAAPTTAVLCGASNIGAPTNVLRKNGVVSDSRVSSQGTGNFGNYPLYIGRRNNATLPFNGRLYGLIVLGAAASDWQIQVTEQWMAGKTGVQF